MTPTPPLSTALADLDLPIFCYAKQVHKGWPEFNNENEFSDGEGGGEALVKLSDVAALARSAAPASAVDAITTLRKYWVDGSWNEASTESDGNEISDALTAIIWGRVAPASDIAAAPEQQQFTARGINVLQGSRVIAAVNDNKFRSRAAAEEMAARIAQALSAPGSATAGAAAFGHDFNARGHCNRCSAYSHTAHLPCIQAEVSPPDGAMPEILSEERIIELDCLRLTHEGDEYAVATSSVIEFARAIEREIAGQPAKQVDGAMPEPTLYQYRTRADWHTVWSDWENCRAEQAADYIRAPLVNDLHFEVRALYAAPVAAQPAEGSAQVAAIIDKGVSWADATLTKYGLTLPVHTKLYATAPKVAAPERSDTPAGLDKLERWDIDRMNQTMENWPSGDYVKLADVLALFAIPTAASKALDAAPAGLTNAARDVLAERRRQVEAEGWTPAHDDEYNEGELSIAAACYALENDSIMSEPPQLWPWPRKWWKPSNERRNLVKAGALLLAEIERLDRARIDGDKQGAQGEKA